MSFVAHTGMFHRKNENENNVTELFNDDFRKIIERVISEKVTLIHKTPQNIYIVSYSESGPFQNKSFPEDLWLPIHIYKMKEWHSGGIKKDEYEIRP